MSSRNTREGKYVGVRKLGPSKRAKSWVWVTKPNGGVKITKQPTHQRVGIELMVDTLA